MKPPRDLEPLYDVKGGSPRTPSGGIPMVDYQAYTNGNGNGVWKAIATGLGGLVVGLLLAWFTAFSNKGVTNKELQEYVEKYSPYSQQKDVIAQHLANQDTQIGVLQGKQDRNYERLTKAENDIDKCNISIKSLETEVRAKMGTVADYLEQRKAKP